MVTYLLRMMTSWAIVCSVWYLPPMTRQVSEGWARPVGSSLEPGTLPHAKQLCSPTA